MSRLLLIFAALAILGAAASFADEPAPAPAATAPIATPPVTPAVAADPIPLTVDLVYAMHEGMASADGRSLGLTSGATVVLTLTNRGTTTLVVRVAPGTTCAGDDPATTPVAIRRLAGRTVTDDTVEVVEGIVLAPGRSERYTFEAFATDIARRDPVRGSRLGVTGIDPILGALFRAADAGGQDMSTIQAAVWFRAGGVMEDRIVRRLGIDRLTILDARDLLRQASDQAEP
jgi:hypothetical protein